jgi:hypothetical protein
VNGDSGQSYHEDEGDKLNPKWGPSALGMHQRGPVMRGEGCGGDMELGSGRGRLALACFDWVAASTRWRCLDVVPA